MRDAGSEVLIVFRKIGPYCFCVYFDFFECGKNIQEIIPLGICLSIIGLNMFLWGMCFSAS
jgi:putative effector of murein hydrolase LrgA (UPF0299 family)